MSKYWLSWCAFVLHTITLVMVFMGQVSAELSTAPDESQLAIPSEPVIESNGVAGEYGEGFLLSERDEAESVEVHERPEPADTYAPLQPLTPWFATLSPRERSGSNLGRAPPQAMAWRLPSLQDGWSITSFPSRGPPSRLC